MLIDTLNFVEFIPVSQDELKKNISKSPSKSCELNPIPTWLLKECEEELLPYLTNIINASLKKAHVPTSKPNIQKFADQTAHKKSPI